MKFTGNAARILDFDCECRPIAWYGGDFVTKQPTAIAWKWIGEDSPIRCGLIGTSYDTRQTVAEETRMLMRFLVVYKEADIVTGHFIRGFDLPLLNGALLRLGMPPLESKMSHDTKLDLYKAQGLSKSQENLGAMFELEHPKVPMNTRLWAEANMLTPKGIAATRKRVTGDVAQHVEMRTEMLKRGILGPPKVWSPQAKGIGGYSA